MKTNINYTGRLKVSFVLIAIVTMTLASTLVGLTQESRNQAFDFGDAPDIPFPTLASSEGSRHIEDNSLWLGRSVTFGPLLRFAEASDDAIYIFGVESDGTPFFEIDATSADGGPTRGYLNVLVDLEGTCTGVDPEAWDQEENHVVRNQLVELEPGKTIRVRVEATEQLPNPASHWTRVTLTREPIAFSTNWDGRIERAFSAGETEDHCPDVDNPSFGFTELVSTTDTTGPLAALKQHVRGLIEQAKSAIQPSPTQSECESCISQLADIRNDFLSAYYGITFAIDSIQSDSASFDSTQLTDAQNAMSSALTAYQAWEQSGCDFGETELASNIAMAGLDFVDYAAGFDQAISFLQDALNAAGDPAVQQAAIDDAIDKLLEIQPLTQKICWVLFEYKYFADFCFSSISVAKTDSLDFTSDGDTVVYTLTVTNDGPWNLTDVYVLDYLPLSATYVSDDAGCSNFPESDPANGVSSYLQCNFATLDDGESVEILVTVSVSGSAGEVISNTSYGGAEFATYGYDSDDTCIGQDGVDCNGLFNEPPVGNPDGYVVDCDGQLELGPTDGVLANDTDPDGDAIEAFLATSPQNGSVQLLANGAILYNPNPGFSGTDTFEYVLQDEFGNVSEVITVTIEVLPCSEPPVANNDLYGLPLGSVNLNVFASDGVLDNDTDPDGDPLTAQLVTDVQNGTLVLNSDGGFLYIPNSGFCGSDSFTYQAVDSAGNVSNVATATIDVQCNQAPIAVADGGYTISCGDILTVTSLQGVITNDSDPDDPNSSLIATRVPGSGPAGQSNDGTFQFNSDGSFTYKSKATFSGTDTFMYTLMDPSGNVSNTATVSINVTC
jgi:uncharacterized repeat protein (TIGR01451 family)